MYFPFVYDFMLTLIDLSKTGIFIILGVIMIRFLLKNAPKKYSYFLWIVVGIRLLCPFSIESILSIFNLEKVITPIVHNEGVVDQILTYAQPFYYENRIEEIKMTFSTLESPLANSNLYDLFIFWLIGTIVIIIYVLGSYTDVHELTKYAIRLKENIYQGEKVQSPFVLGFFQPKIYIPYHLDEQTQEIILEHEAYHIKRKDYLFRFLALGICIVYWFNPFVWLAYHLFIQDMEMSCDEHVLLNKENKTYSSTLLSFATNQFVMPKPLAFGEKSIKTRIKNCLKWKTPNQKTMVLSLLLCLFVLVSFTCNPTKQDNLNDLLKKYSIEYKDEVHYYQKDNVNIKEGEFHNWLHIHFLEMQMDHIYVSKTSITPSNQKIGAIYTFIHDNEEVILSFTESFEECIVEVDSKKNAYKILNHDVAEEILLNVWNDLDFEAMKKVGDQYLQADLDIQEKLTLSNGFHTEGDALLGIGFNSVYYEECDYVVESNQLILYPKEDNHVFVFDITKKGYEILLDFNEEQSKVNSKEIVDILNQITFYDRYNRQ